MYINQGVYHYQIGQGQSKVRLHLRLEEDGMGTLLVNAGRLFHFNQTAALMAYLFLEQSEESKAVSVLTRQFKVSADDARLDYRSFSRTMEQIADPSAPCPVCDLQLDTDQPFSRNPSAPYRMDLALTYGCNNQCAHCYNDRQRKGKELSLREWKKVLDILWDRGIPHIIFTGGEPTLHPDLPELIAYAEKKGQITGINTNGRKLQAPVFLRQLVDAGLDHIQITIESHLAEIHDGMVGAKGAWAETQLGLRNVVDSSLYVMTNTTLMKENSRYLEDTLAFLAEVKVPTVGLNALIYSGGGLTVGGGLAEKDLSPILDLARRQTLANGQRLIWYTPTQYCHFNPMQMGLGVKGCSAALYNMCIEPDGTVIPCQSYYSGLGNILSDKWDTIWEHPLAMDLRKRNLAPDECRDCSLLQECGGGCPLARQAGKVTLPQKVDQIADWMR